MQKPPLEKVIEKLEKIDIREWKWINKRLVTRTNGMTVYLYEEYERPYFELTNEDDIGRGLEYHWHSSSKKEKKLIKDFYKKIYELYDKYKKEELKEMLNNFIS